MTVCCKGWETSKLQQAPGCRRRREEAVQAVGRARSCWKHKLLLLVPCIGALYFTPRAIRRMLLPRVASMAARLVLVGDVMVGRYVNDTFALDARRKAQVWGDLLPRRASIDDPDATLVAGNLECASA